MPTQSISFERPEYRYIDETHDESFSARVRELVRKGIREEDPDWEADT